MTIIKRADLGRPLTWDELDDNFQQVDNLTAAASAAVSSAAASATAAAGSATNSLNSANSAAGSADDAAASATVAINALMNSTFEPSDFDFTSGGTLGTTDRNKAVYNPADNNWYSWSGTLPHVVTPGTEPTADSNWKPRTDQLLRQNLASHDLPGAILTALKYGTVNDAINYITPEMFGGVADGVTNNDSAFAAINAFVRAFGAAQLNLSSGTYLLTQWDIPERLKVVGQGKEASNLACGSSETSIDWFLRCSGSTVDQWFSELQSFRILGRGKVKYSLLLTSTYPTAAVSKAAFRSLEIRGGTVAMLALDGTQNSHFDDIYISGYGGFGTVSNYGIALLNGAANNTFVSTQIAGGIEGIYLGRDTSLGGASVGGLANYPNNNIFIKLIIEQFSDTAYTRTKAIHIVNGHRNKFSTIEMLAGSECVIHVEAGDYNKFYDCHNVSNSVVSVPVVINGGYGTVFANCSSENINGADSTYHVQTSNVILMFNNRAGALARWRVQNTANNAAFNIRHLDPVSYSSNAANVLPTQLDSGQMVVNSGSQLFLGTPAGIKQVPLYVQKSVSTTQMTYTAGSGSNTLSFDYQLTDGYASEISVAIRANSDSSHRAFIRINAEYSTATAAWNAAQILSAAYNTSYISGAAVSVSSSGVLTVTVTVNSAITVGNYRLDERRLINIT